VFEGGKRVTFRTRAERAETQRTPEE
jgi:hypothetical protein